MPLERKIKMGDDELTLKIITKPEEYDQFKVSSTAKSAVVDLFDREIEDEDTGKKYTTVEYIFLLHSTLNGTLIYLPVDDNIEYVIAYLRNPKVFFFDMLSLKEFNKMFKCDVKGKCVWDYIDEEQAYKSNLQIESTKNDQDCDELDEFLNDLPELAEDVYRPVKVLISKAITDLEEQKAQYKKMRRESSQQMQYRTRKFSRYKHSARETRSNPRQEGQRCEITIEDPLPSLPDDIKLLYKKKAKYVALWPESSVEDMHSAGFKQAQPIYHNNKLKYIVASDSQLNEEQLRKAGKFTLYSCDNK